MSKEVVTSEEYVKRYADMYCNGDIEEASKHDVVKEVLKMKEKKEGIKHER